MIATRPQWQSADIYVHWLRLHHRRLRSFGIQTLWLVSLIPVSGHLGQYSGVRRGWYAQRQRSVDQSQGSCSSKWLVRLEMEPGREWILYSFGFDWCLFGSSTSLYYAAAADCVSSKTWPSTWPRCHTVRSLRSRLTYHAVRRTIVSVARVSATDDDRSAGTVSRHPADR